MYQKYEILFFFQGGKNLIGIYYQVIDVLIIFDNVLIIIVDDLSESEMCFIHFSSRLNVSNNEKNNE